MVTDRGEQARSLLADVITRWPADAGVASAAEVLAAVGGFGSQKELAAALSRHGIRPRRVRMAPGGPRVAAYELADFRAAAAAPDAGQDGYRIPAADPMWHERIGSLYEAASLSGQSAFWEPTDWEMLRIGCEVMSGQLLSGKVSAVMFGAWDALMARLLMTEGDRRRMRLELERVKPEADPHEVAGVAEMEVWRAKLAPARAR